MTVYKATHSGDVWALAVLHGAGMEELVATTTTFPTDDVNNVRAWISAEVAARGERVDYHDATTDRDGNTLALYASTTKDELEAAL